MDEPTTRKDVDERQFDNLKQCIDFETSFQGGNVSDVNSEVLKTAEKLHELKCLLKVDNISEQFQAFLRSRCYTTQAQGEVAVKSGSCAEEAGTTDCEDNESKRERGGLTDAKSVVAADTFIGSVNSESRSTSAEDGDPIASDERERDLLSASRKRVGSPDKEGNISETKVVKYDTQSAVATESFIGTVNSESPVKIRDCTFVGDEDLTAVDERETGVLSSRRRRLDSPDRSGNISSETTSAKKDVVKGEVPNTVGVVDDRVLNIDNDPSYETCSHHEREAEEHVKEISPDQDLPDTRDEDLAVTETEEIVTVPNSFSETPMLLLSAKEDFQSESNNFLKGCKWSPDGTCVLTCSEDGVLRLFNLPAELYNTVDTWTPMPDMKSVLSMVEGELIYDYCWYPAMTSLQPESCCFVSTCRAHPVHMWDAFDGQLRCSYRPHDHLDEVITPYSVAFSLDGTKLFCGFNKLIKVFDTTRPGKDCETRHTKGKLGGQTGIISCFAMSPESSVYAAGSYSKTIGIYSDGCPSPVSLLHGHACGVTQLMFSQDGNTLYSSGRKDREILCWDVRNLNRVLYCMERHVTTNQRMYFDIDRQDHHLVAGNQEGTVTVWDLNAELSPSEDNHHHPVLKPMVEFSAHEDAANGIGLHPFLPLLATSSGERKIQTPVMCVEGDSDYETDDEIQAKTSNSNCLKIWSLYQDP